MLGVAISLFNKDCVTIKFKLSAFMQSSSSFTKRGSLSFTYFNFLFLFTNDL